MKKLFFILLTALFAISAHATQTTPWQNDLQLFPTLEQRLSDVDALTRASQESLNSLSASKEYLRNFCENKRVPAQLALERYSSEATQLNKDWKAPLAAPLAELSALMNEVSFECETKAYENWFFVGEVAASIHKIFAINAKTSQLQGLIKNLKQTATVLSANAAERGVANTQ